MATCALCGFHYVPGGDECRERGCPLAFGRCCVEHCPRCGYAVPDETSGFTGWLRRKLGGNPAPPPGVPCRLVDLPAGGRAVVERIETTPDVAGLLTLLGVTTGSPIELAQRMPGYVLRVGGTELAFERAVANAIWVRPVPSETVT